MAKTILHKANERGHANHGWLDTYHSFSFANYYDPQKIHFGALRVLNDDYIAGGMGFGAHPHDNMEIITIPLEGDLEHRDSMSNAGVIKHGDIQVMSAGTGIRHSEYNKNSDAPVRLLQIWIIPDAQNVTPRYDQITLNVGDRSNQLQQILSPNPDDAGVWIHQQAWMHLGSFDKDFISQYVVRKQDNGVYAFVIKGRFDVNGTELNQRDALGIWETDQIVLKAKTQDAEILLIEVPMEL